MDPTISDVSQSRRLTNEIELDPDAIISTFDDLRPRIREFHPGLGAALSGLDANAAMEFLWISQPEVILSRRPRMIPLCAPTPYVEVKSGTEYSSVGIFCRDKNGQLGVTACYHGTGPVGTSVDVGSVHSTVTAADVIQDIAFIPLDSSYVMPQLKGLTGVRTARARSQAEPVTFEGAGTRQPTPSRIQSHDAGILRTRPTVQLKVQTPADTNKGDSGSALLDSDDRVVGFAFERTGIGEFPELTDWIWASNALKALDLTPV